ncbi:sigma-54-dependent Fis family transcriptional regulator [Hwanghaeella grinnelliae]|uniref:Sigma-54-dependent Fis family transcriptional regulator n=1 Tax=Hwanghaeella grinnelliae TaxID=2500179 RepID=A0A437QVK5_9PROT|nr:sigma-54 dependent transcriptional regulator [Hwanghaeella grinnelliae]RVU38535.1 sigma-54-dependent Fis family transcriptional regulator [Hwanghaeella grinnelliae]
MTGPVILVDDEDHLRTACAQALELAGIEVEAFASADGVDLKIGNAWPGVLVTDIKMPGTSGLDLMSHVLAADPDLPVVLITGHGDVPMAVQAMRDGAYDFLEKPFPSDMLVDAVRRALEKRSLVLENRRLRTAMGEASALEQRLLGRTSDMVRLRERIADYAATDADVLIIGETGAGKEMVARSLHEASARRSNRFVAINCGALPESLIESELFGHQPGAFTGAAKKRVGRIEHANGGTLFLDEIESMPMDLQIKLLRVLQDRAIVPLGGNDEVPVDVRVLAATKADLRVLSDQGQFREDLFYRLDVLTVAIPPLRDRKNDVPLLFQHFVNLACDKYKKVPVDVPPPVLAALQRHDWPGNVRELQNAAMRFALGAGLGALNTDTVDTDSEGGGPAGPSPSLTEQMETMEKHLIQNALHAHGNSMKETYEALGVSRKTLYDKMRKYGIKVDRSTSSD